MLFNDHSQGSVWKQQSVGKGQVGDRAGASTFTEPFRDGRSLIAVTVYNAIWRVYFVLWVYMYIQSVGEIDN